MSKHSIQKGQKGTYHTIKQFQSIRKKLRFRLLPERIYHERYYIQRMNSKLQIYFSTFRKDPTLHHLDTTLLKNILNSLDILELISNNGDEEKIKYRLKYPDSDKTVIITGIKRQFINKFIQSQYSEQFINHIVQQKYWISVELISYQQALNFKKIIRNGKKILDQQLNYQYKIQKKRVRIIIQNQDLFTILHDALSQILNQNFLKDFGRQNCYGLTYATIQYKNYQQNAKPEEEYEDTLSEQQSKNSEIVDGKNIKDCIEMHDQGIQAEKIQDLVKEKDNQRDIRPLIKIQKMLTQNIEGLIDEVKQQNENPNFLQKDQALNLKTYNQENQQLFKEKQNIKIKQIESVIQDINLNQQRKEKIEQLQLDKAKDILQKQGQGKAKLVYSFNTMKRLYHNINTNERSILEQNFNDLIPDFLRKQNQKQQNRKIFFDKIWKQSKFGRKNLRKSNNN